MRLHPTPLNSASHDRRLILLPVLAALIGTFIYHRYSILTGLDRVQADSGDSRFVAFLLEHWHNALGGKIDWRSPPIFWPLPDTLAYSELFTGMGFIHSALRAALPVFPAMNAQLIILSLATFATAYLMLARGFRLSVWGATAGAYFIAFSWPRFAQLVHIQLQFTVLTPLLLLLALECLRDGRELSRVAFAWRACAFAALLVLLLATTFYYALFFSLGVSVALLLCGLNGRSRAHLWSVLRRQTLPLLLALLVLAVLSAPVLQLYWPVMRMSRGRSWAELAGFLPTPTQLLWMGRENLAWGPIFGRWPEATIVERWPELRVGVGLVATLAWAFAVFWAVRTLVRNWRNLDRFTGAIVLTILVGFALQVLMVRVPYRSAWWLVWSVFPGANGIRAVARLELVVTVAMGVAFGILVDRARAARPLLRAGVAVLALFAAIEQIGSVAGYSGRGAEALSRMVGDAIPPECRAAFIIATPDLMNPAGPADEAHFDAAAYLAANPDVAAAWNATPWEHYVRFGRAENRALTPGQAGQHIGLLYFAYNYTIPLAASLRGIPVVNGLSGWTPPGWNLFDVLLPSAPQHLSEWLQQNKRPASEVCTVPVRITMQMLPDLPDGLMP